MSAKKMSPANRANDRLSDLVLEGGKSQHYHVENGRSSKVGHERSVVKHKGSPTPEHGLRPKK